MKNLRFAVLLALTVFSALEIEAQRAHHSSSGRKVQHPLSAKQRQQVGVLAQHLTLPDQHLSKFLTDVHFPVPQNLARVWNSYPEHRKLIVATASAHAADPAVGADRLLAMLAYSLSRRGDPIEFDPALQSLRTGKYYGPAKTITFRKLPAATSPSGMLSARHHEAVRAISKYLQLGLLGTPQTVIARYTGTTLDHAFDLLEHSSSAEAALQKAFEGITHDRREVMLQRLVADAVKINPAVKYESALAPLLHSAFISDPPTDAGPGPGFVPPNRPSGAGGGGGGGGTSLVANGDVEASFKELVQQSYPRPEDKAFKSMRTSRKGFGGVIFGSDVSRSPSLKRINRISYEAGTGDLGTLVITFHDGGRATMRHVSADEAKAAYQLLFGTASAEWQEGQGIGLTGLTNECRAGQTAQPSVRDDRTENHERVILNPVLKDSVLGWSAIATDIQARQPALVARMVRDSLAPTAGEKYADLTALSVFKTLAPVFWKGWKITDVPLKLSVERGQVYFARADEGQKFPDGLRKVAYLEMTPFVKDSFETSFRDPFYRIEPVLIESIPYFHQINHFAAVLALVRVAKRDGASFQLPRIQTQKVPTPEFVTYGSAGLRPDPTPICK